MDSALARKAYYCFRDLLPPRAAQISKNLSEGLAKAAFP